MSKFADIIARNVTNRDDIQKPYNYLLSMTKINQFAANYDELSELFRGIGVPTDQPGFCDQDNFLAVEREHPELLNLYAAYVAKRPYDEAYLAKARALIQKAADLMHVELVRHGRLGACVDISGILSRILDREGVWNCGVKGSLTITFPKNSGIMPRYFWSADHGHFTAGHAWLFAPPFTVVDISVKQQPYESEEHRYLPDMVLSEGRTPVAVQTDDIVSPSARREMLSFGVPPDRHLSKVARYVPGIFEAIPPILVPGVHGSKLKYTPVAIHAPDCPLDEMGNMKFGEFTPGQLYNRRISVAMREVHAQHMGPSSGEYTG